jgi:hypothetical protein
MSRCNNLIIVVLEISKYGNARSSCDRFGLLCHNNPILTNRLSPSPILRSLVPFAFFPMQASEKSVDKSKDGMGLSCLRLREGVAL